MRLAALGLMLILSSGCGTSNCDVEGCGEGEACVYAGAYTCETPCSSDPDTCESGTCSGAGSSCPVCQDYIQFCE